MLCSQLGLFCWLEAKEPTCAISETIRSFEGLYFLRGLVTWSNAKMHPREGAHAAWLQRLLFETKAKWL